MLLSLARSIEGVCRRECFLPSRSALIACAAMPPRKWFLALLACFVASGEASIFAADNAKPADDAKPRVWIFNGTPGDDEHHAFYETNLAKLKKTFTERFGIPRERITVLYGPKEAGYDGPCTREALLGEISKAVSATREASPVWLIFQGHANRIPGGANFNLPGRDVTAREIGEALKPAAANARIVAIATTTCAEAFVRPLSAPGRMIIAATTPADPENETEFPEALATALESAGTDSNRDGTVSVAELFLACHAHVQQIYGRGGYMIKEHAQLDGNGDGRATQRPSPADAEPAATVGLRIAQPEKKFE